MWFAYSYSMWYTCLYYTLYCHHQLKNNILSIFSCYVLSFHYRSLCYDVWARFGEACSGCWTCWSHAGMPWYCYSVCSSARTVRQPDWTVPVYTGSYQFHSICKLSFFYYSSHAYRNIFFLQNILENRGKLLTCILLYNLQGKGAWLHTHTFILVVNSSYFICCIISDHMFIQWQGIVTTEERIQRCSWNIIPVYFIWLFTAISIQC